MVVLGDFSCFYVHKFGIGVFLYLGYEGEAMEAVLLLLGGTFGDYLCPVYGHPLLERGGVVGLHLYAGEAALNLPQWFCATSTMLIDSGFFLLRGYYRRLELR